MSVLEIAKKRYSARSYQNKCVEKEKLEKILEAAHVAPTAANKQPVKLLVVQEKENLQKLSKAANIYHAPLAIIVCADHTIFIMPHLQLLYVQTLPKHGKDLLTENV